MDVRGVYSSLAFKSFPSVVEGLTIAVRVRFERHEQRKHELKLTIENSTGGIIGPPALNDFTPVPDAGVAHAWISGLIGIPNVQFGAPGVFVLRLSIDGREESTCILYVVAQTS